MGLGGAGGEDLGRRPLAPPVVRAVEGANVLRSSPVGGESESLVENTGQTRMMGNLPDDLVQRDFEKGRGGREITVGEMDRRRRLVGIERQRRRPLVPGVKRQREKLAVAGDVPALVHESQMWMIFFHL